jgi:hypothetical protein
MKSTVQECIVLKNWDPVYQRGSKFISFSSSTKHKSASAACRNLHKVAYACLEPDAGLLTCRTSAQPVYRDCTVLNFKPKNYLYFVSY